MKPLLLSLLVLTVLSGTAASAETLRDLALETFRALPSTIPAIKANPSTPAKLDLGKALFFDPRLSASGVFSC